MVRGTIFSKNSPKTRRFSVIGGGDEKKRDQSRGDKTSTCSRVGALPRLWYTFRKTEYTTILCGLLGKQRGVLFFGKDDTASMRPPQER
jgi:hypothetical protein